MILNKQRRFTQGIFRDGFLINRFEGGYTRVLISAYPDPTEKKKQLEILHFSSDAEVIAAAETLLDGQPSEFFF